MFRFTIRDVLWLTVVVAMGLGWCLQYSQLKGQIKEQRAKLSHFEFKISMANTLFAKLANRFKEVSPDEITIFENGAVQVRTKAGTGLWLHLDDAVGDSLPRDKSPPNPALP
jgi:hypothetical protein